MPVKVKVGDAMQLRDDCIHDVSKKLNLERKVASVGVQKKLYTGLRD